MSIYDFEVKDSKGEDVSLSKYKDKVIIVVNTASACGYTPQYKDLQALYEEYKEEGLVILGFPCNQFMNQEPGSNEEIQSFCELNFGVTFPVFGKIDVNGEKADPLFKYLSSEAPGIMGLKSIKWNFTKFIINKNGEVIERFAPQTNPQEMRSTIEKLLKA
ncbi:MULTISPECIES: glutathione peroxidase [Bacillaceae]|uniref:Glutathione peroxidase n=1 Tax=Gottfriedia luciferensis TaxID=178774 RepID=A0ABX2ZWM5_9BACI|nr:MULTISPECIES: glutathione peroxidase [Bacillaceae]ODG93802.1 glutathione peroxidase [Gottfriedia luciferensis]PGZ91191.1 glutathione peroxidase [Bacillus sp. AFS029533]SFC28196.1 glutathione peroxidase [Bacillus sp. UNCCL81]